ncbi:SDR family oxidoreductase [Nonomuraea sp. NPDC049709]|uniref:SDR family oxidoreductase n=1 Tax=Nonomuraea sp. NPDC049709 TaxID=3154736 RepID=UPI003424B146
MSHRRARWSRGSGRTVVESLARDGIAVGVHYVGYKACADETVAAVTATGGRAIAVGGDVADEHAMAEAFDAVERELGGIDIVLNTAGIMLVASIATPDLDDLDRMHYQHPRRLRGIPAIGSAGVLRRRASYQ